MDRLGNLGPGRTGREPQRQGSSDPPSQEIADPKAAEVILKRF